MVLKSTAPTRVTPSGPSAPRFGSMRDTVRLLWFVAQILPAPSTATPVGPLCTAIVPTYVPSFFRWPTVLRFSECATHTWSFLSTTHPCANASPWLNVPSSVPFGANFLICPLPNDVFQTFPPLSIQRP